MTVVMSFAGAPAAAAGAGGDGNAGETDQVASVSGVQAQPQAAIKSGDQAHPQAAIGSDDQVQPYLPQDFMGKQAAGIVDEHKFSSEITTSWVVMELIFRFVALGCHIQFNKVGHTIKPVGLDSLAFMSNDWRAHMCYCIHKT